MNSEKLLRAALLCLSLFCVPTRAEIVLIPFPDSWANSADIPTVSWSKADAQALLLFLPGGEGSFGLTKKNDPQPIWLLARMAQMSDTPWSLVFMDSYYPLHGNSGDAYSRWAARRDSRHVARIKAMLEFYKEKFGKPMFLMGHSNGCLSVAEFLNASPSNQQLVAGVVLSGCRNETRVRQPLAVPVMVLHLRADSNRWTTPADAERLFQSIQKLNSSSTSLAWVEGGEDVPGGNPAESGRHMYFGALPEAAALISGFMQATLAK
jgi:pimeloyl-ACP methyl ester carboxylesterase